MSQSRQVKKTQKRIKARRVPAQLYTELSEYASLLRAIRTSETGDLAKGLIRAGDKRRDEDEEGESVASRVRKRPRLETRLNDASNKGEDLIVNTTASDSPRFGSHKTQQVRKRNVYTLWPLFPEHCPTPEFEFEEEIAAVAEEWLREQDRLNAFQNTTDDEGETSQKTNNDTTEDDKYAILSKLQIQPLIFSTLTFLSTLFTSLALHRPRISNIEKRRARPMGWVDVMEIVASMDGHGLDHATLGRIQTRLCEIYGPEESIALKTSQILSKTNQALREMDKKFQSTLFEHLSIPSRIRKRMQAAERAKCEEENEDDDDEEEEEEEQKEESWDDESNSDDDRLGSGQESQDDEDKNDEQEEEEGKGSDETYSAPSTPNITGRTVTARSNTRTTSASQSDTSTVTDSDS